MSDFNILDYKDFAKKMSSASRRKVKTEQEIYQQIASKLKEAVEAGKRRAFVFLEEQKAFYLTVKYGNRVAYVVEGGAKSEGEGKKRAFEYLDALARQDIGAAEKTRLKKAIGKLNEQTEKARQGRARGKGKARLVDVGDAAGKQ
jgi:hypothetical protein